MAAGLRGLYDQWTRTGVEEVCDWSFTLDEERNVLRWDMRECPSKGFLVANDLNADEDYCDHCMGWMVPLLDKVGVEVVAREHNHCGQCWGAMRMKDRPGQPLETDCDIRRDQPGLWANLSGGDALALFWCVEDCLHVVRWVRIGV